jgi:hypothetical protein
MTKAAPPDHFGAGAAFARAASSSPRDARMEGSNQMVKRRHTHQK